MRASWLLTALALVLAGCAGASARGHLGCTPSCNREYDVCSDSAGASRSAAGSYFGAGAACDRELTTCLRECAAAAAQADKSKADKTRKAPEAP